MILTLAWRNLWKHRKKSAIALFMLACAFAALSLFEGYNREIASRYEEIFSQRQMLGDVIIERNGLVRPGRAGFDGQSLNEEEQAWIERYLQANGVENRVRFLNIGGMISQGSTQATFIGLAYDVREGELMRSSRYAWNTLAGKPLQIDQAIPSIVLGNRLGEAMGCTYTENDEASSETNPKAFNCPSPQVQLQAVTETVQMNAGDFEISGLMSYGFAEVDSRFVSLPLSEGWQLYNTKVVSYITARLSPEANAEEWVNNFVRAAKEAGLNVVAKRWQDHPSGELYLQSMDFLNVFKNFITLIILLVVLIAIFNTFVKIVEERIREIGTMRSLGYRPSFLTSTFCVEALLLVIAGSVLGCGLAALGSFAANATTFTYKVGIFTEGFHFRIKLSLFDFLWIGCSLGVCTLFATILPVRRAVKGNIAHMLSDK